MKLKSIDKHIAMARFDIIVFSGNHYVETVECDFCKAGTEEGQREIRKLLSLEKCGADVRSVSVNSVTHRLEVFVSI